MAEISPPALTDTLLLALNQSHKQIQTIQRQALQIEELQRENESLRRELTKVRDGDAKRGGEAPATKEKVQDIFQININGQAEIKRLNKRLKAYKEKINETLSVPLSSPTVSPPVPLPLPPLSLSSEGHIFPELPSGSQRRKRALSPSSPPRNRLEPSFRHPEAIPSERLVEPAEQAKLLTGGGDVLDKYRDTTVVETAIRCSRHHAQAYVDSADLEKDDGSTGGLQERLDTLLATPRAVKSPLPRSNSSIVRSSHSNPLEETSAHDMTNSIQSRPSFEQSSKSSVRGQEKRHYISLAGESSTVHEKASRSCEGLCSGGSLRKRPLQHLSLHHFKVNPRTQSRSNATIDGVTSDGYIERIQGRKNFDRSRRGNSVSGLSTGDFETLVKFLGAGSEAQIARLSLPARSELLSKARRTQEAESVHPGQIESDIHGDPPGFWNADMPGTQEHMDHKMLAREKERREVESRYHDAMTTRERWLFADE